MPSGRVRRITTEQLEIIERLASYWCTNTEIAAVIKCDASLLSKPFYSELILKGKDVGRYKLRKKMMETALGGNCVMMIWLSKQLLGYVDKVEQNTENVHLIAQAKQITEMPKEELIKTLRKELALLEAK